MCSLNRLNKKNRAKMHLNEQAKPQSGPTVSPQRSYAGLPQFMHVKNLMSDLPRIATRAVRGSPGLPKNLFSCDDTNSICMHVRLGLKQHHKQNVALIQSCLEI